MFLERLVEAFNEGRFDDVLGNVTEDYLYIDPSSGPLDAPAHRVLMETVLTAFPDRQIRITRSASGDGVEFGEGTWTGESASGEALMIEGTIVIEIADGKISAQRWYYQPPANSPLRSS